MSPLTRSNHTAARIGRWSANHWKTALVGWLVVRRRLGGGRKRGRHEVPEDERHQRRRGPQGGQDHLRRLQAEDGRAGRDRPDPVQDVDAGRSRLPRGDQRRHDHARAVPEVRKLKSPLAASHRDQVSDNGHAVMVTFTPKGDYDHAAKYIDNIEAAVAKRAGPASRLHVEELGSVSTTRSSTRSSTACSPRPACSRCRPR